MLGDTEDLAPGPCRRSPPDRASPSRGSITDDNPHVIERLSARRFGQPENIANAVLILATTTFATGAFSKTHVKSIGHRLHQGPDRMTSAASAHFDHSRGLPERDDRRPERYDVYEGDPAILRQIERVYRPDH